MATISDQRSWAAYAEQWAEAWNRRDIDAVLSHFHDEVVFTSPSALAVVGTPTVRGKGAVRDYWTAALKRVTSIHFRVDRVLWDERHRELAIIYFEEINGRVKRVSENLCFDPQGRVVSAEVFHGVPA